MVIDQDDRTILQRKGRLESTSKSSHSGVHNRRMTMRAGIEESSRVSQRSSDQYQKQQKQLMRTVYVKGLSGKKGILTMESGKEETKGEES